MSSESHQACLDGRVAIEMDEVNRKMDPMGKAILDYVKRQGRAADYHKTGTADKLRVFSPMFEEDEIPLATLFRKIVITARMLQRRNIHQVTAQQKAAILFQPLARIFKDKMILATNVFVAQY